MTGLDELCDLSLVELAALIARREVLAAEATEAALQRIEHLNPVLNAFGAVTADRALARARELDVELGRGSVRGSMHGVPVSLKDNIAFAGVPMTAGSPLLQDSVPEHSAVVADRLEAAGAVVVGKANLWEFAYGAPSSLFGRAFNPWDPGRTTGASSSGSAVAVAAGLCAASLGTDSGGSIRIPASFCGVVGLKPTSGLLSTEGTIPVSPALDHVGPITRTVDDAALVLAAVAGIRPEPGSLAGARIGLPAHESLEPLSAEVAEVFEAVVELLREAGATVEETAIPRLDEGCEVKWKISGFEASRHHDEQAYGPPSGYDPAVRRLLELGRAIPVREYGQALRRRAELRAELERTLAEVCILVLPATPMPAFPVDQEDEDALLASTRFTALFSVTGAPALVVPAGLSPERLPIGLQLVGRAGADAAVLSLGSAFERERGPLPPPPAARAMENSMVGDDGGSR